MFVRATTQTLNALVMSDVAQLIITSLVVIFAALMPIFLKKNKPQDLLSEDIEEITNPDGSKIKREKRKFK